MRFIDGAPWSPGPVEVHTGSTLNPKFGSFYGMFCELAQGGLSLALRSEDSSGNDLFPSRAPNLGWEVSSMVEHLSAMYSKALGLISSSKTNK